jgi:hypothetical protein
MTPKSQLKQYFETGKIPTQAQFGELINSFINIPSRSTENRGNQNLFFGNGEENPYIQGVRIVSKIVSTKVINMFIFSKHNNNASSFPLFILNRTSTKTTILNDVQATVKYCIPNKLNVDKFVKRGLDCDNSTDDEIIAEVSNWEFKPFEKEVKKSSIVTIIYTKTDGSTFVCNCIMGMEGANSIVPICIHTLGKLKGVIYDDYFGAMSILQQTVYNNTTVKSEWEKIMELQGYEDGLVIDNSGVVEKFMSTIYANCYKQIPLK